MKNLIIYTTMLVAIGLSSCSQYTPTESTSFDSKYKTYKIVASKENSSEFVIEYQ